MPRGKLSPTLEEGEALLAEDRDFLRPILEAVLQELPKAERTETLGAAKGERTPARLGCRAGHCPRAPITRVGKRELRVPRDRPGRFATELLERYPRSAKALVAARAEMSGQGGSTRNVEGDHRAPGSQRRPRWSARSGALCGHSFSAAALSAIHAKLDAELARFARRRLDAPCPYLIVDARSERVRAAGVIRAQAVLLAVGIGGDGRRSILAVELANRESRSSWREFLLGLRERGLAGVERVAAESKPICPVDNAARCPQAPTTATTTHFAEDSGHNSARQ